jgi:asparagine synthase (glutamine-hydrolysing)
MCGISGYLAPDKLPDDPSMVLDRMNRTLTHRGPDDTGCWWDERTGIGFGHCRLSIVDLSQEGHQPMHSASGRYVTTFNGEIYNFTALRQELERLDHRFRGHSDTEVMLAAFDQWGVEAAIKRLVGMFAFALWDRQEEVLYLVRDRMGEKPLYYGWMGDVFLFGSTLKALQAHPAWRGEINRDALALFMRHNYIPAPYSIYRGVHKLLPGTILKLPLAQTKPRTCPQPVPYWSAREAAEAGIAAPFKGSEAEAVDELDRLLRAAVAGQMVADVPLGAFLSGGIDSSTVVALMQAQSSWPVKTFTIGFEEAAYNEAEYAKAVAQHLGTDHTELYVRPAEALAVIPRLPTIYDEPFADSSQIPTFLVSQLARARVKVSLSGDGGDELFCGYNRYLGARTAWRRIGWMPRAIRQAVSRGVATIAATVPDASLNGLEELRQRASNLLHEWSKNLASDRPELIYHRLVSHWEDPTSVVTGAREPLTVLTDGDQLATLPGFTERMMYLDQLSYLPDDILVKVDRASMALSLEARVPLLDHRVVEFAWRVPLQMKFRQGQSKWLLRQVLYRYVPPSLIERPKSGFSIPLAEWLRGPLRQWAEVLLDEHRLREEGFFDPQPIREKWAEHLSGRGNRAYDLWTVLMFQAWLEQA